MTTPNRESCVSVIGLGKVGLVLASCLVHAGHRVFGVDIDAQHVANINAGRVDTCEPGAAERLARGRGRFEATTGLAAAVRQSDFSLVIVPTPSNVVGGFSVRYVRRACQQIAEALRTSSQPHTVAVVSTMLPGSSDRLIMPVLEAGSGRRIGDGLGYCYNPAFIALGDVVKGFEQPDYVLVGESDVATGDRVIALHRTMVRDDTPIARMSPVEAEITKIASNTHETMRVSFANMLLSVCSQVPGADVDRITEALAHRMGRRFFKGALPYGGPCWPRDNRALAAFMDAMGVPSRMPKAVDLFNRDHGDHVLRRILALAPPGERVGVLGLAYKPGTPVVDESFALRLARWLVAEGRPVTGWDPLAMPEARRVAGDAIEYAESGDACLAAARTIVIGNPLPEFTNLDWSMARDATVIDCWRCLPPESRAQIGNYVPLGRGPHGSVAEWLERTIGRELDLLTN